jgi:uncharacterized protein YndB with AHSA1/START domain
MSGPTREINITRVFYTPGDPVWHAWTDPEILNSWCGPKNYTFAFYSIDLWVSGKNLLIAWQLHRNN